MGQMVESVKSLNAFNDLSGKIANQGQAIGLANLEQMAPSQQKPNNQCSITWANLPLWQRFLQENRQLTCVSWGNFNECQREERALRQKFCADWNARNQTNAQNMVILVNLNQNSNSLLI